MTQSPPPMVVQVSQSTKSRRIWIAVGCVAISASLVVWTAFTDSRELLITGPALAVSLALLLAAATGQRSRSSVTISDDRLTVPSFADAPIPWTAIRSATLFKGTRTRSLRLAVVMDSDRIRAAYPRGNSRPVSKSLLETVLDLRDYEIEAGPLLAMLRERIGAARGTPAPSGLVTIQVHNNRYTKAFIALLVLVAALGGLARGFQVLRDDRLREKIAAPDYPPATASRAATALSDIRAYPRDSRVRLAYAERLSQDGRLADAETELSGALADTEALRAISHMYRDSRGSPSLKDRIEMALAIVLAREHQLDRAKAAMGGLCRYVRGADMPMLTKLNLCHYSAE